MTTEEIRLALEEKIKELEWKNNLRSLEVIEWLKELISKLDAAKEEPTPKKIKVELPDEEEKPAPKKKVIFKKK